MVVGGHGADAQNTRRFERKKNIDLSKMVVVVSGDMLLLKDRLSELGLGKIQILEKDGSGKFKYLKSGKTKHIKNWK